MIEYFQTLVQQFMHPYTAVAQLVGFAQMILGFFVFRNISRRATISIKALCDLLAAVHFAMLSQWTGMAVCLVNIGRGVCFAQRDLKAWATGIHMPVIFGTLTVASSLWGWTGWESLLPMTGSLLALIGYWCRDTRVLRRFNLVGINLWLVYNVIVMSVPSALGNVVYITSILLTMIRVDGKRAK